MKKIFVFLMVLVVLMANITVFAEGENCIKLTFKAEPDNSVSGGWVNVKGITGTKKNGEKVTVTVFNGGNDDISCFLSGREPEAWLTVAASDTYYVGPGETLELEMDGDLNKAYFYLLELRELQADSVVYIMAPETTDYSDKLTPMSDLIEGGYCTATTATMPKEGEVQTPEPTPTPTPEPTATPTLEPTPTPTNEPTPSVEATEVPVDNGSSGNDSLVTVLIIVVGVLAAIIIVGGVVIVIKKKK